MKKMLLSAAAFAVVAVSAVAVAPKSAEAVPAFARQTGAACMSCHFQAIPRLAAFGRSFRMNAFRDVGAQALLEGDHLSLPAVFNASLLFKARLRTNQAITGSPASSELAIQWPDEAALLIGGRYGEHLGGITEWSGGPLSYKIAYVFDLDAGIVGIAGGSTDALGATYLFFDPSNVLSRPTRGWQHRATFIDNGSILTHGVSGVGVYGYLNDMIYFALGGVIPNNDVNPANPVWVEFKPSLYARAAWIGEIAGFDSVIGAYYSSTDIGALNATALGIAGNGTASSGGIDLQFQGDLGGVSVGFYMPWQFQGEDYRTVNAAGQATLDHTGVYPLVTVGFGHMGVKLGYDYTDTETIATGASVKTKTTVVGAWYSVAQNVELDLEYNNVDTAGVSTNNTTLVFEYVY